MDMQPSRKAEGSEDLGICGSFPSFRAPTLQFWVAQAGGSQGEVRSGDGELRVRASCLNCIIAK